MNPQSSGNENGKRWQKKYERIQKHLIHYSDYIIADGTGTGITSTMNAISDGDYTMLVA